MLQTNEVNHESAVRASTSRPLEISFAVGKSGELSRRTNWLLSNQVAGVGNRVTELIDLIETTSNE